MNMYQVWWPQHEEGHIVRFRLLVDALRYIASNGREHDAWLCKEGEVWQPAESFELRAPPPSSRPPCAQQVVGTREEEPSAPVHGSGVRRKYVVPPARCSEPRRQRQTQPWLSEDSWTLRRDSG